MTRVNWTNRDMLVLPLGSGSSLAAQAGTAGRPAAG